MNAYCRLLTYVGWDQTGRCATLHPAGKHLLCFQLNKQEQRKGQMFIRKACTALCSIEQCRHFIRKQQNGFHLKLFRFLLLFESQTDKIGFAFCPGITVSESASDRKIPQREFKPLYTWKGARSFLNTGRMCPHWRDFHTLLVSVTTVSFNPRLSLQSHH